MASQGACRPYRAIQEPCVPVSKAGTQGLECLFYQWFSGALQGFVQVFGQAGEYLDKLPEGMAGSGIHPTHLQLPSPSRQRTNRHERILVARASARWNNPTIAIGLQRK